MEIADFGLLQTKTKMSKNTSLVVPATFRSFITYRSIYRKSATNIITNIY